MANLEFLKPNTIPDEILYLVHVTYTDPRDWTKAKLLTSNDPYHNEYPGTYFTMITKQNINNVSLGGGGENLGKAHIGIFDRRLLFQKNYHINPHDVNGFIHQNTIYPFQLDKPGILKKLTHLHEVVFHDPVSLSNMAQLIAVDCKNTSCEGPDLAKYLPKQVVQAKNFRKNDNRLPQFVFPFSEFHTGVTRPPKANKNWWQMQARLANVTNFKDLPDLKKQVRNKVDFLKRNRTEQRFEHLLEWVATEKSYPLLLQDMSTPNPNPNPNPKQLKPLDLVSPHSNPK